MKEKVKLVVVLPVGPPGPKLTLNYVLDTLHSLVTLTTPDRRIIILDDSGAAELGGQLQAAYPEVEVFRAPRSSGGPFGGLYYNLSLVYLKAYAEYDFQVLLKLDTDALITGQEPEADAIALFERAPDVGQIGTYRIMSSGEPSEFSWPRQELLHETGVVGCIKDLKRCRALRELLSMAERYHYDLGEHCLGGAVYFSGACIARIAEAGWFAHEAVARSLLAEDHLFSLLARAAGFRLGEFGGPNDPMAVQWKGLPDSPQRLLERGKKIVHSTRFWRDMPEGEVRAFFQQARAAQAVATS
ncbi:MAG: hypothetical protein JW910_06680 [Anaerolineae bacterium]|nr:hypothetical protein [Anaerolineae bacterium]